MEPADRIAGSIYGVLVCDALGGPVQFKDPGKFKPVTDLRAVTPFDKPAGAWSDDGSMTLCIAQSLVEHGGAYSHADIAHKFFRWHFYGYLSSHGDYAWDVGGATRTACLTWASLFERSEDVARFSAADVERCQQKIYASKTLNATECQGNGSLMRVAPIGVAFHADVDTAMRFARQQGDITHPHPACGDACVVYTRLLAEVLQKSGSNPAHLKVELAKTVANMDISDRTLRERLRSRCPPDSKDPLEAWSEDSTPKMKSTGWVVDTLDAALWAFFTTDTFKEGALKAVNLGGDSDSVGAVYGGLAGAFYGRDAIPERWREGILEKKMVATIVEQLVGVSTK